MDGTLLSGWPSLRLDRVRLCPVTETGSFGFLDPADILRQSHMISDFSHGKIHLDGVGISQLSRDSEDDVMYYVNRYAHLALIPLVIHPYPCRFVDRDMAMRYLPGLGVGHTYAHSTVINPHDSSPGGTSNAGLEQDGVGNGGDGENEGSGTAARNFEARGENPEGGAELGANGGGEAEEVEEGSGGGDGGSEGGSAGRDEDDEDEDEQGFDDGDDYVDDEDDYTEDEGISSEGEESQDSSEY